MRLLLDTHAALWWLNDDRRLSAPARRAIENPGAERFLSIAAAWEMAIKSSLGRLKLPRPLGSACDSGSQCESGDCLGAGSDNAFCTRACNASMGCGSGYHCRDARCVAGML